MVFIVLTKRRSWKWFILSNKTLSLSYYRNGTFVNEEFVYFVTACKHEYLAKYRDLIIQETSLEPHIRDVIKRFVWTGNIDKGQSPGRSSVSEEVVDDLRRLEQNPQTFLTRFPQESGVLVATWNETVCPKYWWKDVTEHFFKFVSYSSLL